VALGVAGAVGADAGESSPGGALHLDAGADVENRPTQEQSRLIGELLTDKGANMSAMLLECVYGRRAVLYASEALVDEHDSYWNTGLVPEGGVKAHHLCPGALCSVGSLEEAILCGMRHVNKLGRKDGGARDHIVRFQMDQAARTTKIDATYLFRSRMVNLAVREQNGTSSIVLYVLQ
jgi:hypothetical protein